MLADPLWARIPKDRCLDIGCGNDPLPGATGYDLPDDAAICAGLAPEYSLVYSSHCIEHIRTAPQALARWWSLVRPGGWLWVLAPDWQLYEHGIWPSAFNTQHLWRCRLLGETSETERWLSLSAEAALMAGGQVMRLATVDTNYDYTKPDVDQTKWDAEASIELVVWKVPEVI
ncbi:MAG: hypothetical protein KGH65_03765 [Candidatus Micrarchaeota archaeon]|nr:hypothetical protein [Candidatus Micrarchaeota archaeon]